MPRWQMLQSPTTAIAIGVVGLCAAFAALGYSLANSSSTAQALGTVEVTASGTATGVPNVLTMQLSVNTTSKSAAAALNKNNSEMHHLQALFIGAGVAAKELQTSNLSVSPQYNNNGAVTGYGAEDDLMVTFTNIKKAGSVIDAGENAVGNDVEISSVAFSFSSDSQLMQQARIRAMQSARSQASDLARGAGETLGPAIRVSEQQTSVPPPQPVFASGNAAVPAPVPIRRGTSSVSVSVDVTFDLS